MLRDALSRVRAVPDHSLLSVMAQAGLPDEVTLANARLAVAGGINEPQHMITSGVWALGRHPTSFVGCRPTRVCSRGPSTRSPAGCRRSG